MKKILTNVLIVFVLFTVLQACKKDEVGSSTVNLQITSFYPNSGKEGTLVTIEGEDLSTELGAYEASVAGINAEVISSTATKLVIRVPENATSGKIKFTINSKEYEVGDFTYQDLTISSIFPTNGPAGSQIRITGAGFGSTKNPAYVTVNGKEALVVSVTDIMMVVEIPAQSGTGPVVVKVDSKESQGQNFKYQEIESIKPLTGGKGTNVTITGVGFEELAAGNIVDFNGRNTIVVEATENKLVVNAPDGVTTGPLSVTINNQKITGPTFSVVPFPIIKAVTPMSAPAGSEVVITGENYSLLNDEVIVTINGVKAAVTKTNQTSITIRVPENTGQGLVLVNINDQSTQGPQFKEQNLGISRVFPDNGLAGDQVTITGLGFSTQTIDNRVLFNSIPATVVSATSTELKVIVPANVTTGPLVIEAAGLQANAPSDFKRAGVMTLAGGTGSSDFTSMLAITVDSKGNVYVSSDYNRIKKITPTGVVSVFAGSTTSGAIDNVGENARFNYISGLATDENDNIYVADNFNRRIRKITPEGIVTTTATLTFNPISLAADKQGNIYVGHNYSGASILNKVTGGLTRINVIYEPADYLAPISPSEIYYAPGSYDYLRVYSIINDVKSSFAGNGQWGLQDGPSSNAMFRSIIGLATNDKEKILYFADAFSTLRKIENGVVTTLAGLDATGQVRNGYEDGSFVNARFNDIKNICIDKDGNIYVVDNGNKAVRKVIFK